MRVLVGPRLDLGREGTAEMARALAGCEGIVVSLRDAGVRTLSRPLSKAEVSLLREALSAGRRSSVDDPLRSGEGLVGYICGGVGLGGRTTVVNPTPAARGRGSADVSKHEAVKQKPVSAGASTNGAPTGDEVGGETRLIAVTDHANLTWRSPLAGPNDESFGPRFPSMTGIYEPGVVLDRLGAAKGMIVMSGVVSGVCDDRRLRAFEVETAGKLGHAAASSELVPVVIVAAHMGLRMAAVVVVGGFEQEETSSGRP